MTDKRDTPTLPSFAAPPAPALEPTYRLRITALAWKFPSLLRAEGVHPWDPERFQAALLARPAPAEALHAARFVLSVWNRRQPWALGAFHLHTALRCWDEEHRDAFRGWLALPWWR